MTGRTLSALAFWRPVVRVERVDLSDGETLQWSGTTRPRLLERLGGVARTASGVATGAAERVGGTDDAPGFHLVVDLASLLDAGTDIVAGLTTGRRRVRVEWAPTAFENVNAEFVRPVVPDLDRGVQRALRREPGGAGVRVVATPLAPRHSMVSGELGSTCRVHVAPAPGSTPAEVGWLADDRLVRGRPIGAGRWEWTDLSELARPGTRWALQVVDEHGPHPVHLPHSDLRGTGPHRAFPIAEVGDDGALTLALGIDGGNRVVLRCRPTEPSGEAS